MLLKTEYELLQSNLPFFTELTSAQKAALAAGTSTVHYADGALLNQNDRSCIGLILLIQGEFRVFMTSPAGKDITLFRLSEGTVCVLSAACVLDAVTFHISIRSEADSRALIVAPAVLKKLCTDNIYAKAFCYEKATERFSEVMWTMQQILFMKADQRLALFLQAESMRTGSTVLTLTHEKIAEEMNSAREVVTRMLRYLTNDGIVKVNRGTITIQNPEALRQLAEQQ